MLDRIQFDSINERMLLYPNPRLSRFGWKMLRAGRVQIYIHAGDDIWVVWTRGSCGTILLPVLKASLDLTCPIPAVLSNAGFLEIVVSIWWILPFYRNWKEIIIQFDHGINAKLKIFQSMVWRSRKLYGYSVEFAVLTGILIHEVIYELSHLRRDRSPGLFLREWAAPGYFYFPVLSPGQIFFYHGWTLLWQLHQPLKNAGGSYTPKPGMPPVKSQAGTGHWLWTRFQTVLGPICQAG